MSVMGFADRASAGQRLAEAVAGRVTGCDLVLALPRGGVPVAAPVARRLGAELDLMVVRKLGLPGNPELAMGALAPGEIVIRNEAVIAGCGVTESAFAGVLAVERRELERRLRNYRGDRPLPQLAGRRVLLVDDGIATGATLRAAIAAVRRQRPAWLGVATPVAPAEAMAELEALADDVICLLAPERFTAIGAWYGYFSQTSDDEVRSLLARAWATP